MKKLWIIMLIAIALMIGTTVGLIIFYNNNGQARIAIENNIEEISDMVTDECIDEYEIMEKVDVEANSEEEKVSPNCQMIFKRYYKDCKHTTNEYADVIQDLVNKTESDLRTMYSDWIIEKYSATQVILYKEFEGNCGQHFVLRDDDGKITVYRINVNNEEELYEKTEISVEYLTETDKIQIQNGISVNGVEELNQLIENFE